MTATDKSFHFQDKILEIPIEKISTNPLNPRKNYNEISEDELLESIITKGILNPIVVFRRSSEYVILDGERRYHACKKLKIKKIPARILDEEPNTLETLSLMFHIHNVRDNWTEFAISITIKLMIDELGLEMQKLTRQDILELTKLTSLSEYKIGKYLKFHAYPHEVIERFLKSEMEDTQEPGADPDILLEMHKPINDIRDLMPDVLNQFPVPKIIDICITKKAQEVIKNNKEFRLLSKTLEAVRKKDIRRDVVKEKIIEFLTNIDITPEKIYSETSASLYQYKSIIRAVEDLRRDINNLNIAGLKNIERKNLKRVLSELFNLFKSRF